jgi:hypothetical protein
MRDMASHGDWSVRSGLIDRQNESRKFEFGRKPREAQIGTRITSALPSQPLPLFSRPQSDRGSNRLRKSGGTRVDQPSSQWPTHIPRRRFGASFSPYFRGKPSIVLTNHFCDLSIRQNTKMGFLSIFLFRLARHEIQVNKPFRAKENASPWLRQPLQDSDAENCSIQ